MDDEGNRLKLDEDVEAAGRARETPSFKRPCIGSKSFTALVFVWGREAEVKTSKGIWSPSNLRDRTSSLSVQHVLIEFPTTRCDSPVEVRCWQ